MDKPKPCQPSVRSKHGDSGFRLVEIALHHLWAADPDLTLLPWLELRPARRVDDLTFGVGDEKPGRTSAALGPSTMTRNKGSVPE